MILENVYENDYATLMNDYINNELGLYGTKISDQMGDLGNYWDWNNDDAYLESIMGAFYEGNLNYDVLNNRKNIAIVTLYEIANTKDKKKLKTTPNENLYPLIEKYHIINLLKDQLNDLYKSLIDDISMLKNENISLEWINSFQYFLNYIKTYGENRLKK